MNIIQAGLATVGLLLTLAAGSVQADERWGDEWWVCTKPMSEVGMVFACYRKGDASIQIEADMATMGAKGLRAYSTTTEAERLVVLFGRMASAK